MSAHFGRYLRSAVLGVALLLAAPRVNAERLALKIYTNADGLADNSLFRIRPDSRGFLWFCTGGGLSRFDGRQFVSFGREYGLPYGCLDLIETRDGDYWLGTDDGVRRLKPPDRSTRVPSARFEVYRPDGDPLTHKINALKEDPDGSLWCGTGNGLYKLRPRGGLWVFEGVDIGAPKGAGRQSEITSFCGMTAATCGSAASAAFIGCGPMAEWNATRPSTACLMVTSCHFSWIAGGCYGPGPGEASAGSSRIPIPPAASSSGSTPPKTAFPAILCRGCRNPVTARSG